MKNKTKGEHYIPRFFLKQFCDETGHIAVFVADSNSFRSLFLDHAFQANNLFEVPLEGIESDKKVFLLQNELETAFRNRERAYALLVETIIQRVNNPANTNAFILNEQERALLDELTANLLLRILFFIKEDFINHLIKSTAQEVPHPATEKYFHENKLGDPIAIYKVIGLHGILNPYEQNGLHRQMQNALSKLNCSFYYSPEEPLIAGNNLVHFDSVDYSEDGPDLRRAFFTLCPHIAVVYQSEEYSKKVRNQIVLLSPENAMEYNMEYLQNIPKKRGYLFARDRETLEKALSMWKTRC